MPQLEFCLLGPVVVRRDGLVLPLPRGSQRAVLAALLLNVGRVVSVDELAETLWGATPRLSARATVRNYVKRLRRVLGEDRIVTMAPGYAIRADPAELDVARFEGLLEAARKAARDASWQRAADQAGSALALWRGEALADVRSDLLALGEVPRLAELRLQAAELRIGAELHLGRPAAVIAELEQLAAAHPLRERLHGLLMMALCREGRRAEALAAYRHVRRVLVAELGTEPGAELRELHQKILEGGAGGPADDRGAGGWAPAVPRELPGPVRPFVGREAELKALTRRLDEVDTVVISVVGGTAGVGKTALAVHWAHHVASRFPDGQLYVNLRGYDPGPPVRAADALAGFLRGLGVPDTALPAGTDERAARYRSLLAGRRMLVVLDNACGAEQVRPLLPGSRSCVTVVTSRDSLGGLVARDGARRLDLDLLPETEAVGLLRALIGERVDAEPAAAAGLAARCAWLPLALRVAAERAAAEPGTLLADLLAQLADQRLDLLEGDGDPRTAIRAVFSWSFRHLDEEAARSFRLLGLHPGLHFDAYAVAALAGVPLGHARRLLDRLARAGLIQPAGPGRYGLHDLLRAYAAEQGPEAERRAALTRLFDYYLAAAAAAADAIFPADTDQPRVPRPGPVPPVANPAAALAWLDAQRADLVAVAGYAARHGWPGHAIGLAATVFRYPQTGDLAVDVAMHGHACRAAAQTGDRAAEAAALTRLGRAVSAQGRLGEAAVHFERALAKYREAGDGIGEARALVSLGFVGYGQGRYRQSAGFYRRALALYRQAGVASGEATVWQNLGLVDLRQGRHERAAGYFGRSLTLFRDADLRSGEAFVLRSLGELELQRGRYVQAADHLRRSLALCRQTGNRFCEARALACLGLVRLRQDRPGQAVGRLRRSLALHREAGNPSGQAEALNGLGEALLAARQATCARARHADALALAIRADDRYEQARANRGLARALLAAGDAGQAAMHWRQALAGYAALGIPEAEQVRAEIAAADGELAR
jgi:DNA-binding SARP family transcriptional activator/tetratricopeptide (TPR) repeat protein